MNCIIIDDEPLAIGVLTSYCEDLGGINIKGTFTNPFDALGILSKENINLVFLDIEMPQINGIDFLKTIDHKPLFVFTTAYPQYAIEGFELNAVDYLVKPIPFMRFVKAINRAKEILELRTQNSKSADNLTSSSGGSGSIDQFIFVKSDYDNVKVKLEAIKYIQGLKDYLKIHTNSSKPVITLMSFKNMQAKLPSSMFIRVHRSFIVNINQINSIQRSRIVIDDMRIPIGDIYRDEFMRRIGLG
ncbi:response regulator transcription factor [Flagellimonas allohymeniacidonis]|uniref:Response regulator transcription factor n=2 Tax=Flagellimonas allohymeniacidonis TaxID=2517819 RepID=A0A4Q8QJ01_9FLAO|nr:response regulator transcription factor [Allomuricauda hymeniacidonis]